MCAACLPRCSPRSLPLARRRVFDGLTAASRLSVSTPCDAGGNISTAVEASSVTHTCPPGYVATAGAATRTCVLGAWDGTGPLVCTAIAPNFNASSLVMRIPENSPVGFVVSARGVP